MEKIQLKEGQEIEDIDGNVYKIKKGDILQEIEENIKSDIGSGYAKIYRGNYIDSKSVFNHTDEIFVAKDLESAKELSLKGKDVVLVTNSYKGIFRAYPVVDGNLLLNGMWDGSFIYTSDNIIMKGYPHPIRLMARIE